MSTSYVSQKLKVITAKNFRDSFRETIPRRIGYVFLAKSSEYPNSNVVTNIAYTVADEKQSWDDMILAKRVIPNSVEFVVPRYNWIASTVYRQYDDTVQIKDLLSEPDETNLHPMYVMNADGDVYKCLCNNVSQTSIVEPTGNYTENDGFIQTADGYLWKYMYNIKPTNKFLTPRWMPVPYVQANTDYTEYDYNSDSVLEGSLNKIVVTNNGTGYFHPTLNVEPFTSGVSELTISDDIDLTTANTINVNMLISGTGIFENKTYISQIDPAKPKTLILSEPTISSGGGTSNSLSILTRVVIDGDGTETVARARLSGSSIIKIDVLNAGLNYTEANVIIYGSKSSSGAQARAVFPPKFGHNHNPALELIASNVMIVSRIGEIDATENNTIPTDINFRQYGLLINAYKYDEDVPMDETNSLDIVSQTLDLSLLASSQFNIGEMVYQGNINDPTFVGYVVYQDSKVVKLNNVYKIPTRGLLIGLESNVRNSVVDIKYPDLKPYYGDILFARNVLKVQRSVAQAEEVKLIFQF
jgi:hypothetical protein